MANQCRIEAKRLRELLFYDHESGVFHLIGHIENNHSLSAINTRKWLGYLFIRVDGICYRAHRLAWLYVHGKWPYGQIDHRDGDRCNNRISNLRDVTNSVNQQNLRGPRSHNTSGFLGISRNGPNWKAEIGLNGGTRYLGTFKTKELAYSAYLSAKRLMHEGSTI